MNVADLAELPLAPRLQSMEVLWASLERDAGQSDVIPVWHEHVVSQRLATHGAGQEPAKPWAEAKSSIHQIIEAQRQAVTRKPERRFGVNGYCICRRSAPTSRRGRQARADTAGKEGAAHCALTRRVSASRCG